MGWKNWSFWVRGGTLAAGLFLIFTLLGLITKIEFFAIPYLMILLLVLSFSMKYFPSIVSWLPDSSFPQPTPISYFISILIAVLVFFGLGTIVGWIYSRNTSKK